MSTGTESVPGNNGIKDVREALRWIQENIRDFNGDPNSVTLIGHGAGGIIVHHLALSKSTEGLFDKYITLSGTVFSAYSTRPAYLMRLMYLRIAETVSCASQVKVVEYIGYLNKQDTDVEKEVTYTKSVKDDIKILNCLKHVNYMRITRMVNLFVRFYYYHAS